ncbi:MAG: hypothetical protein AB7V16_13990 [Vulcanibacillus sp.]
MEEQYITFETAKLAKEKGCKNSLGLTPLAFDCTQTFLQKWLREVHNIHINIKHRPHSQSFCFTITGKYQDVNDGELVNNIFSKYKIYELALEAALQEALKLI